MNPAQENLHTRLRRTIREAVAHEIMRRLDTADPAGLVQLRALATEFNSETFGMGRDIADRILQDWKVTERPRGERRVQR